MYSQSNSFLGGANSGRPGQQQYGQPQQQQQQQQQQYPSQTGFSPQHTSYGGGLQPQMTGYPGGQPQLQAQYTGFTAQPQGFQQQQQPPPMPPMPTGFQPQQPQPQQPMQTGIPPAPRQQPQPTGMTSAQMANSFRSSPAPSVSSQPPVPSKSSKIPSIRLSFITAQDQAKFEQLFKSAVGSNQAMSGDQARDVLLRSKLPGNSLSEIWLLSDTTKSGQLLFPEFALAMYLCNLKMNGQSLPATLPDKIKNEVSSMVDIISFGVADDASQTQTRPSHVPNFEEPRQSSFANTTTIQQPQAQQPSNSQLLSSLISQPTGFQPQPSFQVSQPTGMLPQQTGYPINPQPAGYNGPRPPMPPMPTGFQQPPAPLNAQPTGLPGQWGLVNTPATGLPNIEALGAQMMPQAGREGGFTSSGLRGNATVPWAVTKDEKKIYDNLFKSWDGFGKGFITGSQALEILGQSGLEKSDLERIWTLSDPGNKGRLDLDEFAVAMHLIYRRLNGYPVPNQLPPELVPPSTRNLTSVLGGVKSMLQRDAEERKNSANYLEPQKTGVSYLKNRSFQHGSQPSSFGRKDATVFKNDDTDVGYRSSARRRIAETGRSPSPAQSASPPPEDLSLDQLRKKIREKQVMLDAIDFQDENAAEQDDALDRKDRRDAEDLYSRIRKLQEDIDNHPSSAFKSGSSEAERRTLKRQLQGLTDRLPELASQVRRTERSIADARLELFRLKDAKAHPGSSAPIVGTGPDGAITEADRLKARAKAMMQQRAAALSGRPAPSSGGDDPSAATKRLEEESSRVRNERETNDRMVGDVEESVKVYSQSIEESLKEGGRNESSEHERRRWEDGLGVEDEVKDFISDLQRNSRSARIRREDGSRTSRDTRSTRTAEAEQPTAAARIESPAPTSSPASRSGTASPAGSYQSYKTPEERAAFIKQQAEARMAERMAALGLRAQTKGGETPQQRQEREKQETEARRRQAEEEDAKREHERQRRLADESIAPPSAKKPPPPPSRKGAAASLQTTESKGASRDITETALQEQQQAQQAELTRLEYASPCLDVGESADTNRDEAQRQEEELRHEKEASEARRKALEEQVRQGKVKKEEEKRRRKAEKEGTRVREERLAVQRAEIEAARKQEEELQRQLAAMDNDDDSSDDDEGPQQLTPMGSAPATSQELSRETLSSPSPTVPPVPSINAPTTAPPAPGANSIEAVPSLPTANEPQTNNPFFKRMQSTDQAPVAASVTSPSQSDTNPFHRMSQPAGPNPARLTPKPDDDDWSVVDDSDKDDSDDESNRGTAGGAKHLASILFGTMGPPRPMSSMGDKDSIKSPASPTPAAAGPPVPDSGAPPAAPPPPPMPTTNGSGPPPPPPMPGMGGAPPAPPPPPPGAYPASPPPPPAGGIPPPPPPPAPVAAPAISGLLGEIQKGKGLKKVQTKDASESAVRGRVL